MRLYNVKSAEVRHLLSSCQEVLAILMGFLLQQASKWLDCHKASRWCRAEAKTITVSTKLNSFIAILPPFFQEKKRKCISRIYCRQSGCQNPTRQLIAWSFQHMVLSALNSGRKQFLSAHLKSQNVHLGRTWANNFSHSDIIWAASWQNKQSGRLRSAWASAQSDQSLCLHLKGSLGPKLSSSGQRRLWSDWVDAQADLSLPWMHTHFVGFVMRRLKCPWA